MICSLIIIKNKKQTPNPKPVKIHLPRKQKHGQTNETLK